MPLPILNSGPKKMRKFLASRSKTVAAALVAPFFFDSDERGYMQTSLLTTPAVFIGAELYPRLFNQTRDTANTIFEAATSTRQRLADIGNDVGLYENMSALRRQRGTSMQLAEEVLARYMRSQQQPVSLSPEGVEDLFQTVSGQWRRNTSIPDRLLNERVRLLDDINRSDALGEPSIKEASRLQTIEGRIARIQAHQAEHFRLYSSAAMAAEREVLTPTEWSKQAGKSASDLRPYNIEQVEQLLDRYRGNEKFLRGFQGRLSRAHDIHDLGASLAAPRSWGEDWRKETRLSWRTDIFASKADEVLSSQPKLSEMLRKADRKRANILGVKAFSEKVISGETGDLYSIAITRQWVDDTGNVKQGTLDIYIPDANGQTRMSPSNVGVGRYVMGPDGNPTPIHEWVVKNILEHPELSNEQFERELAAGVFWQAGDPLDPTRIYSPSSLGDVFSGPATRLKSKGVFFSTLPIWGEDGKTFEDLESIQQRRFVEGAINRGTLAVPLGPESGPASRVFQLPELENISYTGVIDPTKQNEIYRFMSKDVQLVVNPDAAYAGDLKPRLNTTAFKDIMGVEKAPEVNMVTAGISPGERSLFGDLPATWAEAQQDTHKNRFLERARSLGASEEGAQNTFKELESVYNSGYDVFGNIGRMGETDFFLRPDFAEKVSVMRRRRYKLDESAIPASMMKEGSRVSPKQLLGMNNLEPVVAEAEGVIESVSENPDGLFDMTVVHRHSAHGAKPEVLGGIKGQSFTDESFGSARGILNFFRRQTGSNDIIGKDVVSLVDYSYYQNKASAPEMRMAIAADVMGRVEKQGQGDLISPMVKDLDEYGMHYSKGQLTVDWHAFPKAVAGDAASVKAAREARIERLIEISDVIKENMNGLSQKIAESKGFGDEVLQNWAQDTDRSLEDYILKNAAPANLRFWAHSDVNLAREATATYDLFDFLNLKDTPAIAAQIQGRLQAVGGGNVGMAQDFGKYLLGGDYSQPMYDEGDTVVDLKSAFLSDGSLSTAAGREKTVLDPSDPRFKKNYRLRYLDQGQEKFIPVPGNESFGATAPLFGPGRYQTQDWQKNLHDIWEAERDNDLTRRDNLLKQFPQEMNEALFSGKNSAFRPRSVDKLAHTSYLTTWSSPDDPFRVGMDPEQFSRYSKSRRFKGFFEEHGYIPAVLTRQPLSAAPLVKVVPDAKLKGTRLSAIDESLRQILHSDDDLDPDTMHFIEPTEDARREVLEQLAPGGPQERELAYRRSVSGAEDVGRAIANPEVRTLDVGFKKLLGVAENPLAALANRTASEAIGFMSNASSQMVNELARTGSMMSDQGTKVRLQEIFHEFRQTAINARKSKTLFDKEAALQLSHGINNAFSMATGGPDQAALAADELLTHLQAMANMPGMGEREWQPEMEALGLMNPGSGQKVKPALHFLSLPETRSSVVDWMANRNPDAAIELEAMVGKKAGSWKRNAKIFSDPEILSPMRRGARGGSFAAEGVAEGLGAQNLRNVTAEGATRLRTAVSEAVKSPVGRQLGLGLGIAAMAGIALSAGAHRSLKVPSSNQHRPEERIGTQDAIPGEPVPGTMSAHPPRRATPAPTQVDTAVVAPVGRITDLEVRMKAKDRAAAAETAKLMAAASTDGQSNVTVNYRGNTRLRSLRTREQLREMRDQ